jgi:MFS family permease
MGLSYSPLSLTVLREADPERQGEATAGLQLSDVLGSALGAGVAGAILAFGGREGSGEWLGLAGAFGLGFVGAVVGLSLTGRLPGRRFLVAATVAPRPAVEEPSPEVGVGGR